MTVEVVFAVALVIACFGFGFLVGALGMVHYISRTAERIAKRAIDDETRGGELSMDPRLADIVRTLRAAHEGDMPAAAGQVQCVAVSSDGRLCDRPEDHDGPHAYHAPDNLVYPIEVWN